MSGVFTRGRMRLYLLKLLEERPRHGYEILQLLQERLGGGYAPSPGSVYPRLRRLDAEGLIAHDEQGGRKVYRLTELGSREVARRQSELDDLELAIRSASDLAEDIGEDVRSAVRDIDGELRDAARGFAERGKRRGRRPGGRYSPAWPEAIEFDGSGGMIDAQLHVLVSQVRQLASRFPPSSEQIGACAAILDECYRRIAEVLAEGDDTARE